MTNDTTSTVPRLSRRTFLTTTALCAGGVATATTTATAESDSGLDDWFSDVDNYDGVVDKTGKSEVRVEVGSEANGGAFGFGPAAVRVSPGTKVVWEWTGKGGAHNVVAEGGAGFESEMVSDAGYTFEHTFEDAGSYKYYCLPHKAMGMKGAVVVGGATTNKKAVEPEFGDWFADVDNFDGVTDRTGKDEVTVEVGTDANGGAFGFGPAAIQVNPGTKVVWKWTGKGGAHNVVTDDGTFESEMVSDAGYSFEHTFGETGTHKYYCLPHKSMGMKGAVVVTESTDSALKAQTVETVEGPSWFGKVFAGSVVVMMLAPIVSSFVKRGSDDGTE
ncbi:halocyanin domain-containing protein [Haladaptatus sp. NG-SE-30]